MIIEKSFYEDKHKKIIWRYCKENGKIKYFSIQKQRTLNIKIAKDGVLRSSNEILTQKGVDMKKIREIWSEIPFFNKEIDEQIEINAHYRGYFEKAKKLIFWHLKEMKI